MQVIPPQRWSDTHSDRLSEAAIRNSFRPAGAYRISRKGILPTHRLEERREPELFLCWLEQLN